MIKISGLESLQQKLKDLEQKATDLNGKHDVPLTELLTDEFLSRHTKFSSLDSIFNNSGFSINSPEDFAAIPDDEWDAYIRSVSEFENWRAMLNEATKDWTRKKLGLGK